MSRYFFHLQDRMYFPDVKGVELADLDAAKVYATRLFAAILIEVGAGLWDTRELTINAADETGRPLFSLSVIGAAVPAGRH